MPNPVPIQDKINALKRILDTYPEQLAQIRDLCAELTAEIDKHLQTEKRQYARLDLVLSVKYAFYGENKIQAEQMGIIRDISLGGASIEMKQRPSPETPIVLNLLRNNKAPIQIKGRVLRVREFKEGTWLVSVEFTEIEEKDLRAIFRFLAENYG
jgi:c-di-GMP-binding flagellar brake protein YcgR